MATARMYVLPTIGKVAKRTGDKVALDTATRMAIEMTRLRKLWKIQGHPRTAGDKRRSLEQDSDCADRTAIRQAETHLRFPRVPGATRGARVEDAPNDAERRIIVWLLDQNRIQRDIRKTDAGRHEVVASSTCPVASRPY